MSVLGGLVKWTERIEGLNGIHEGIKKLVEADGALETTAAVSQLAAEVAVASVTTATLRTSMSTLRLGLAISGQAWKWEALSWAAGASASASASLTAGQIIDWVNDQHIGTKLYDWTHPDQGISDPFNAAQRWQPRRDPLTLELDGDGLETLAPSSTHPILFDHDGDGTKSGTGWIKADDGFLVLDRNSNGVIDSGSEWFVDANWNRLREWRSLRPLESKHISQAVFIQQN